ncbi:hypothetical protein [Marinobacter sp.]|uniref:hypothetical protein n=1 Tax=Marinobacter sp. TaxID=50741 RepID=UPI00384B0E37
MAETTPLLLALVFGSVGIGYLVYGRRPGKRAWFYTGLALLVLPYLTTATLPLLSLGVILLFVPRFIR